MENPLLAQDESCLDPNSKQGAQAIILIQLCLTLDAYCGSDVGLMIRYMSSQNSATSGIPLEQIQEAQGLEKVMAALARFELGS